MASTISPSFAKIVAAISCTVAFCAIAGSSNISFIFAEIVSRSRGSRRYCARYFTACNCDGESSGISSRTNCCYFYSFVVVSSKTHKTQQRHCFVVVCVTERERQRVSERSYSCETKPREISFPERPLNLSNTARSYASKVVVVVKPSRPLLDDENETKTSSFLSSLLERCERRDKKQSFTYLVGPQGDVRSIDVTILLYRVRGG